MVHELRSTTGGNGLPKLEGHRGVTCPGPNGLRAGKQQCFNLVDLEVREKPLMSYVIGHRNFEVLSQRQVPKAHGCRKPGPIIGVAVEVDHGRYPGGAPVAEGGPDLAEVVGPPSSAAFRGATAGRFVLTTPRG